MPLAPKFRHNVTSVFLVFMMTMVDGQYITKPTVIASLSRSTFVAVFATDFPSTKFGTAYTDVPLINAPISLTNKTLADRLLDFGVKDEHGAHVPEYECIFGRYSQPIGREMLQTKLTIPQAAPVVILIQVLNIKHSW